MKRGSNRVAEKKLSGDGTQSVSSPIAHDGTLLADVLLRIRSGDECALGVLYQTYYTSLWRLALTLIRSRDLAEEILQDVFLSLWRRREMLKPNDDIRAYLYSSVRNRINDHYRHQRVVDETHATFTHDDTVPPAFGEPDLPPDLIVEKDAFYTAYRQALATLNERDRLALLLRWEEDMTYEQIAQVFGLSIVGARGVVLRAQDKVQKLLSAYRG